MYKITVRSKEENRILYAEGGRLLSEVLIEEGIEVEHPCGGKGTCRKCIVKVDGESVLSCGYIIESDIEIELPRVGKIETNVLAQETESEEQGMCLCLDVGTTTLVMALISKDGKVIKTVTRNNPQRAFAADVMTRIEYSAKNGEEKLQKVLIDEIQSMLEETGIDRIDTLYAAGNTTMLHLLYAIPCGSMGYAPYTPVFIGKKEMKAADIGIKNVEKIISLPGISAFVGADIVAGLGYIEKAERGRYNFLVDLGTNAEVVLYSDDKLYCTAAAAGPCFEGVNISKGMSATEGAICSVSPYGMKVIGDTAPVGICATGLIDAMALMLDYEAIDETGFMEEKEYEIAKGVSVTQGDVRQFQLAKSAICSAMETMVKKAGIDYEDIDKVYVSGGFASKMNFGNAIKVGLLPKECEGKLVGINNSCLQGLVKYAVQKNDLSYFTKKAEYVDLAMDEYFQELFIENMMF